MDGYCDACSSARCDCYPDECPVKYPPPQAQDAHAAALARAEARLDILKDCDLGDEGLPCADCEADKQLARDVLDLASRLVVLEQERAGLREALREIAEMDMSADDVSRVLAAGRMKAIARAAVSVADSPQEDTP